VESGGKKGIPRALKAAKYTHINASEEPKLKKAGNQGNKQRKQARHPMAAATSKRKRKGRRINEAKRATGMIAGAKDAARDKQDTKLR